MSIIIVEGIDRVGKTTLVKKIEEWFETDPWLKFRTFKHHESVVQYDKMDNDNETDKMLQLVEMVELCSGNVIFDRFHMSDFAYGLCDRKYGYLKACFNIRLLDDALCNAGAVLVYVKPTSLDESSSKHGNDLKAHDMLMDVAFKMSDMKKICTDFNEINDESECERLINDIRELLTEV